MARSHISWRNLILGGLAMVVVWVLYLSRGVLSPFVFAIIFAYLLNPVVSKISLPRPVAILVVYLAIITILVLAGVYVGSRIIIETREFTHEARVLLADIDSGRVDLPIWLEPYIPEISQAIRNSITISSQQIIRFFSGALSSLLNLFIFALALFYFLKEGHSFVNYFQNLLPSNRKEQTGSVLIKVNRVLSNYFLAQFSLVLFMGVVSTIAFMLMGVKYAVILGIIVGLAEVVPIVGPTVAFVAVTFVSAIGGGASNLNLPLYYEPLMVGLVYVLLNQVENILIVPQVTGRMVELHPLLILASVLIGGHLFGAVGFLLAVPIVASIKVIIKEAL